MHTIFALYIGQRQRAAVMASHDSKTDLYGGIVLGIATLAALMTG
jgi:hypothetical protein